MMAIGLVPAADPVGETVETVSVAVVVATGATAELDEARLLERVQ